MFKRVWKHSLLYLCLVWQISPLCLGNHANKRTPARFPEMEINRDRYLKYSQLHRKIKQKKRMLLSSPSRHRSCLRHNKASSHKAVDCKIVEWYYTYITERHLTLESDEYEIKTYIDTGFPQGGVCSAKFLWPGNTNNKRRRFIWPRLCGRLCSLNWRRRPELHYTKNECCPRRTRIMGSHMRAHIQPKQNSTATL